MTSEALNLGQWLFVDGDGLPYPIVSMFDVDGLDCGPCDAVAAVAGVEGRWFALDLSEFNVGAFQ